MCRVRSGLIDYRGIFFVVFRSLFTTVHRIFLCHSKDAENIQCPVSMKFYVIRGPKMGLFFFCLPMGLFFFCCLPLSLVCCLPLSLFFFFCSLTLSIFFFVYLASSLFFSFCLMSSLFFYSLMSSLLFFCSLTSSL